MINIEQKYSEENYLVGEALYEAGAIKSVVKDKSVYAVEVIDKQRYTVTIKSFATKRMAALCSCHTFQSTKECCHIVAALLHLRAVTAETTKTKRPATYTVNAILQQLTKDDLVKFLKYSAAKDKSLNYMLKAVFAEKVQLEDNSLKYSTLLSNLIKPSVSEASKGLSSDGRLAIRLMQEFGDQLDDALTEGKYTTAFDIIRGIWSKAHYLYRHYKSARKQVLSILLKINKHISNLYAADLAPSLLAEVDQLIVGVGSLSYYNFIDRNTDVVYVLYRHKRSSAMASLHEVLLSKEIDRLETDEVIMVCALSVLLTSTKPQLATDQQLIQTAHLLQQWDLPLKAIELLSKANDTTARNRPVEYALVDAYYKASETAKADEMAIDILVRHREFRYLRKIKDEHQGAVPRYLQTIISDKLEQLEGHYRFKAMYYRDVEDDEKLLAALDSADDLQLLMEHDGYLYRKAHPNLQTIYLKAINNYLDSHVGSLAGSLITEVMAHLERIAAFKLHSAVKHHILQHYPHRIGLIEYR